VIRTGGSAYAARHEARLLWSGNKGLYALLEAARHTGPITRVPKLGWVVTDPLLARQILNDHVHFSMVGEGGVGHMWAQLFGEEMAGFFGGARHTEVRTKARDLFTEESAQRLVQRSQGPHYEALAKRLTAGETVDVADATRVLLLTYLATTNVGPFDIRRDYVPETRQLWFGGGRHLCLGAAVARTQITRMLETLLSEGRPYRVVSRRAAARVLVPTYASLRVALVS
jgi:cytochrome P450